MSTTHEDYLAFIVKTLVDFCKLVEYTPRPHTSPTKIKSYYHYKKFNVPVIACYFKSMILQNPALWPLHHDIEAIVKTQLWDTIVIPTQNHRQITVKLFDDDTEHTIMRTYYGTNGISGITLRQLVEFCKIHGINYSWDLLHCRYIMESQLLLIS